MRKMLLFFAALLVSALEIAADTSISPVLFFMRETDPGGISKPTERHLYGSAPVTVRFSHTPDSGLIDELERSGITFTRRNGELLHTLRIYHATVELDSLESLSRIDDIIRIESTFRPSATSTLDVSNPQVQASLVWDIPTGFDGIDGSGVLVTNIDTGVDVFHPGFFKTDGGTYQWIDFNRSGSFESGVDVVDLNGNGSRDPNEILDFYDASCSDPLNLIDRKTAVFDADLDWLYNDANRNGERDYGPDAGYTETDPSFGERIFLVNDTNRNRKLDPGESLTALGTSKIAAVYDAEGIHYRGRDLFDSLGDTENHGTGSSGIIGGQAPGRRFAGMAPGVEFFEIDRTDADIEEGILLAKNMGTDIMLYEFASWVFEFLDGSSNLEVLVSDLYDEGIHQFTASGNLAGPARKKHARFEISRSEQDSLYFTVSESGITQVYISLLWKQTFLSPTITLTSPDSRSITINGDKREHPLGDLVIISGKDISPKQTNRMDIIVKSETPFSGDFAFSLQNRRALAITIDSYIADNITQWMNGTQFQNHVTDDGTVCTPGTTEKDVTVGAYDPRGTRNTKGDINDFSSWGLTTDGRRALDITAPGTLVYSLTSHQAVGGHPGGYIDFGGTSAALPHVAGCAALIVQASPGISPEELANALYDGALVDEFTGQVPNPIWGYGKIRVYDSLVRSGIITSVNSSRAVLPTLFSVSTASPNPFNSRTSFSLSFRDVGNDPIIISVYNILGQKQYAQTIDLLQPGTTIFSWNGISTDGEKVSSGVYLFHFRYGDTAVTRRALYLK